MKNILFLFILFIFSSCKSQSVETSKNAKNSQKVISDTSFVRFKSFSKDFNFDLKYATSDNFLKTKVYNCAECYLRYKTVKKLIEINSILKLQGLKIKLFDCYRPLDVQKKMWKLVPNTNYVADPKKGSVHNRGCAVDLTLVTLKGVALDMGTTFDFFGEQANHDYQNLSDLIISNRKFLKKVMLDNGFKSINSEWWHYNLIDGLNDKVANFNWECK